MNCKIKETGEMKQLSITDARSGMDTIPQITISNYSGYRHNRYDGYCSSWGILMACEASPTADCFASSEDYELNEAIWNGDEPIDHEVVLQNLDCTDSELVDFLAIEEGETVDHTECWGSYEYIVRFKMINKILYVFADADGDAVKYIVNQ